MPPAVFVFEGTDVSVFPSIADAQAQHEAYDVAELTAYLDDGTRLLLVADWATYGCRIEVTPDRDLPGLRAALGPALAAQGLDVRLADAPRDAAQAILGEEWSRRPFQWWPWLDRRVNGPVGPSGG